MLKTLMESVSLASLPSRERGLKSSVAIVDRSDTAVAPLAGAGIEIGHGHDGCHYGLVAPRAGAWIEILQELRIALKQQSRSPRGSVD